MNDDEVIYAEQCILRPGQEPGWVYFIACSETGRCKIGYTKGNVQKRLKSLQTGSAGSLMMLAKHPGTPDTERRLHERFQRIRVRGEWFDMMDEELFSYVCLTTWIMASVCLRQGTAPEEWILRGLRTIREHWDDKLTPELEALIA